jgi:hypothetical protein
MLAILKERIDQWKALEQQGKQPTLFITLTNNRTINVLEVVDARATAIKITERLAMDTQNVVVFSPLSIVTVDLKWQP